MPVVTMLNMKGGVGKSSTCHHLAGTLAKDGRRVLLVDNDPQSSLSQGFWGPAAVAALDPDRTVAAVYAGADPFPDLIVRPTGVPGVDLVPGSMAATEFNIPLPGQKASESLQHSLRDFLDQVSGGYDLTLVDCPPNLHLCSWAALVASDFMLVPLQPEDYGSQGIAAVGDSFASVKLGPNPGLHLLGFLLTMFNKRTVVHQMFERTLRGEYGEKVFTSTVPYAVDFKESVTRRQTIAEYKPKGASAKAMKAVAAELFGRIAGHTGTTHQTKAEAGGVA